MHSASPRLTLEELKIRARILMKALRSEDSAALVAAERLRRIPRFSGNSAEEIVKARAEVQLKHALIAVAGEQGYPTWEAAKQALEPGVPRTPEEETGERLHRAGCGASLNHWFTSYEEARAQLLVGGGYLMPYRKHFFVCESGHLEGLNLSPDDPDWERIGHDWVKPADLEAWRRLSQKVG